MPKTKEQKNDIIKELETDLKKQIVVLLFDFKGVDSKTLFKMRDELKANDAKLSVVKKTLLQKASKNEELKQKLGEIKGQLALVFGFKDEAMTAKTCYKYTKENEKLKIIGGILENEFNIPSRIIELAQLPTKQELLGQVIGCLNGPVAGFARGLQGVLGNVVSVFNEIQKVK